MSVTKRHCWRLWLKGWTMRQLMAEYQKPMEWVEDAIRIYHRRSQK